MYFKRIVAFTSIALLYFSVASFSDDKKVVEDFSKIKQSYKIYPDLILKVSYKVFADYSSLTPTETKDGIVYKHNDFQYSELVNFFTLATNDYLIVVDTGDKKILVGNPVSFNDKPFGLTDFSGMINQCKKISYQEPDLKHGEYTLELKSMMMLEYSKIDIYFDKKTFLINKITLFYKKERGIDESKINSPKSKPRIEIVFESINTKPRFPSGIFSDKRFIRTENGHLIPSKEYSSYELINQKISKK